MEQFNRRVYHFLVALVVLTLGIGTIFYHIVEKFSYLNAYYFSVVTLSTIGYGDLTPHTNAGKIFTTFYIFVGVGIITAFITMTMKGRGARIVKRHDKRSERKKS